MHGRLGDVRPRVGGLDRLKDVLDHGVVGAQDVNVGFKVENVVVHRAREGIVNTVAVAIVLGVKGRLDIAGCANCCFDQFCSVFVCFFSIFRLLFELTHRGFR